MNRPAGALLLSFLILAGCAGPMGQREAVNRAANSLKGFCQQRACGASRLVASQKIKDRWLVDFETAGGIYTVSVDNGGNTKVSIWDKAAPR